MKLDYKGHEITWNYDGNDQSVGIGWMNLPDGKEKIPMLSFELYTKLLLTIGLPGPSSVQDPRKSRVKKITNKGNFDRDYMRLHLGKHLGHDFRNGIPYRPYDYDLAHGTFNISENLVNMDSRGYCEIAFLRDAMVNAYGFYYDKDVTQADRINPSEL